MDSLNRLYRLLEERLNAHLPDWTFTGERLDGPGSLALVVRDDRHDVEVPPGMIHADIGFILNKESPDVPVMWDCAVGWGSDPEAVAVESWFQTAGSAVLSFLKQGTEGYAQHVGGEEIGCPGWHLILGRHWGVGAEAQQLSDWLGEQVLPPTILRHVAATALGEDGLIASIKLVMGGATEVRVNGEPDGVAAQLLRDMLPPGVGETSMLKTYVIVLRKQSKG